MAGGIFADKKFAGANEVGGIYWGGCLLFVFACSPFERKGPGLLARYSWKSGQKIDFKKCYQNVFCQWDRKRLYEGECMYNY